MRNHTPMERPDARVVFIALWAGLLPTDGEATAYPGRVEQLTTRWLLFAAVVVVLAWGAIGWLLDRWLRERVAGLGP